MIEQTRIYLSALWVALMLTYLLGDVLRIFAGDFIPGEISGVKTTQMMWLGIAILMLTPIVMMFLSLMVAYPVARWLNIIVAVFWFLFNLVSLPTYPSLYDPFLLAVGMVFNVLTVGLAWNWI